MGVHVATCGYVYVCTAVTGGRRTGGHPGGRYRANGNTYKLALWGEGGHGGSPNVEAGKMHQHAEHFTMGPFSEKRKQQTPLKQKQKQKQGAGPSFPVGYLADRRGPGQKGRAAGWARARGP
jgi:hypothetical protein